MSVHDQLTRDGLARLAVDCSLLLDYLSRTPDTRLDWCFQETRSQMSGVPPARLARPPADARTKEHFVQKLISIAQKVQKADGATFPLKPDEVAFLLTSRDFLSAIAWPATVESIRVTEAYNAERRRHDAAVHEASEKAMGLLRATQRPDPSVELSQGFYRYCDYVENRVIPTIMTQSGGGGGADAP
jgi:hypothetical protein